MIDELVYGALTDTTLSGYLEDDDIGWKVYPRSSLGKGGIPASPPRPYIQYGETSGHQIRATRETRFTVIKYIDVYVYDDAGSFQRIKKIHELITPLIINLSGRSTIDGRTTITEAIFNEFGQDGYDTINDNLVKLASYQFMTSANPLE